MQNDQASATHYLQIVNDFRNFGPDEFKRNVAAAQARIRGSTADAVTRRWTMRALAAGALLALAAFEGYKLIESPGNQLFGKTLVSGPKNERVVALTYDDGPNPPYTTRFSTCCAPSTSARPSSWSAAPCTPTRRSARREVDDGNAIGNHTWNHGHLLLYDGTGLRKTLERTDAEIYAATGVHTRIMRPPFGARDWLVLGEVRKLGYTPVMWSVPLANDWEYPPARVIASRVLRYVGDGSIIALHDGNQGIVCRGSHVPVRVCDRSADVEATRLIVERLKREGYKFVTIPELLQRTPSLTHTDARAAE